MTWRGRVRTDVAVPVGAALVTTVWAVIGTGQSFVSWAGALGALAFAWAALRGRAGGPLLAGQGAPLSASVAVLSICGAGLDQSAAHQSWRPFVAVAVYPFLGKALLRLVAAHCQVREADVLVEAALIGTAVGILVTAAASGWVGSADAAVTSNSIGALSAALVALDVALLVVAIRCLRSRSGGRVSLGMIDLGIVGLLVAHTAQQIAVTRGEVVGPSGTAFVFVALLAFGGASLHPSAFAEPDRFLDHPGLFSAAHAGVVAVALLAAPTVLAVQTLRSASSSATVATGAVISGTILASYLVGLLRERATTEHRATHDGLTGLPNRTLLVDRFDRAIAHARRTDSSCAVLFMDLDRFKEVNDTFGHAAGDGLLRTVAARLTECVRDEDTVARLSGDEFVILLPHLESPDHVVTVATRVLESIGHPVTVAERRMLLAGSIGIAVYPHDGETAGEVLASADAAMYRAKDTQGGSFELFSTEMATQAQARLRVEAGLLDGLARDELVLHYQPIVDLDSRQIVGAEALIRWNHPDRGFLLPGHFVPIAEQSDLIVMLGEKVIFDACQQLRAWQDLGLNDTFISVNASARQFKHGLVSTVTAALRATGANPRNLIVELTEGTVVDNIAEVAAALQELADMGVRSAIDDFGTGYCGLRYLGSLPVASLKIDRTFTQGMTPSDAAIVAATIAMGHSLGLTLIAEGVETDQQLRLLAAQGCDRVQGYLFGRPMPADELLGMMRSGRVRPAAPEIRNDQAAEPAGAGDENRTRVLSLGS